MSDWGMSALQRAQFIEQYVELGVSTFDHADILYDLSDQHIKKIGQ